LTPFIQRSARQDILEQYRYLLDVESDRLANRFLDAVNEAVNKLARNPNAGASRRFENPALSGLRSHRTAGFEDVRICHLTEDDTVIVVRVLHNRQDLGGIFTEQGVDAPDEPRSRRSVAERTGSRKAVR